MLALELFPPEDSRSTFHHLPLFTYTRYIVQQHLFVANELNYAVLLQRLGNVHTGCGISLIEDFFTNLIS